MFSPVPVRTQRGQTDSPGLLSQLPWRRSHAVLSTHSSWSCLGPRTLLPRADTTGGCPVSPRALGTSLPSQAALGRFQGRISAGNKEQHCWGRAGHVSGEEEASTASAQSHSNATLRPRALNQVVTFTQLESGTGSTPQAQSWLWNGTETLLLQPKPARSSQLCCPNSRAQTPPPLWCPLLMGHHSPVLVLGTN